MSASPGSNQDKAAAFMTGHQDKCWQDDNLQIDLWALCIMGSNEACTETGKNDGWQAVWRSACLLL